MHEEGGRRVGEASQPGWEAEAGAKAGVVMEAGRLAHGQRGVVEEGAVEAVDEGGGGVAVTKEVINTGSEALTTDGNHGVRVAAKERARYRGWIALIRVEALRQNWVWT